MKRIWRSIVGGCLTVAIASVIGPGTNRPTAADASDALVKLDAFTKLKKVHLVRPDLIGYPLLYEFVC